MAYYIFRKIIRSIVPKGWQFSELVRKEIERCSKGKVIAGIFSGMQYVSKSVGSEFLPKILGTYEKELATYLLSFASKAFDIVVVVGAAEGYYAVGFAFKWNTSKVVAFEPDKSGRRMVESMAFSNGVAQKVRINGICDAPSLRDSLEGYSSAFVFMDIEGGEAILLDPSIVPSLQKAMIIVEIHEPAVPGVGALLRRRFSPTHEIQEVFAVARTIEDYPLHQGTFFDKLKAGAAIQAMSERRPPNMSWLILSPKASG
jgi:hypothetical protein